MKPCTYGTLPTESPCKYVLTAAWRSHKDGKGQTRCSNVRCRADLPRSLRLAAAPQRRRVGLSSRARASAQLPPGAVCPTRDPGFRRVRAPAWFRWKKVRESARDYEAGQTFSNWKRNRYEKALDKHLWCNFLSRAEKENCRKHHVRSVWHNKARAITILLTSNPFKWKRLTKVK